MCVKGWKNPLYNPAGIKVITREFQHQVGPALDLRGGEKTADHVDILGNYELTVKKINFFYIGICYLVTIIINFQKLLIEGHIENCIWKC